MTAAEFYAPDEMYYRGKQKKSLCTCCRVCCCCCLFFLLFVIAIGGYVAYLLPFSVPGFKFSHAIHRTEVDIDEMAVKLNMSVSVVLENKNKIGFALTKAHFTVEHNGVFVTDLTIGRTDFPARKTTTLNVPIVREISSLPLVSSILKQCNTSTTFSLKIKPVITATTWFLPCSIEAPQSLLSSLPTIDLPCGQLETFKKFIDENAQRFGVAPEVFIEKIAMVKEVKKAATPAKKQKAIVDMLEDPFYSNNREKLGVNDEMYEKVLEAAKNSNPEEMQKVAFKHAMDQQKTDKSEKLPKEQRKMVESFLKSMLSPEQFDELKIEKAQ